MITTSYRLEDFLLFSESVYWRLFELHNAAWWPLALAGPALGALAWLALTRGRGSRPTALLLAAAWSHAGLAFVGQRYASINWAAEPLVPAFLLQAALLLSLVVRPPPRANPNRASRGIALGLIAYAVAGHPWTALAAGRPLAGAELFALAPDPLAFATLGYALLLPGTARTWLIGALAALWCALSATTLLALGSLAGGVPLVVPLLAAVALVLRRRLDSSGPDKGR